ncbi:hypothetical protein Ga0100231_008175 [Opitutaceae bacterium TAV4]|nr:hypothetical protein Ga0100231_008175 [Opitutaceae bacterium TAV4]RRJ98429.1 hypothetical protein Ga0100230_008475 [Opitutaceae bacterium TAV3]
MKTLLHIITLATALVLFAATVSAQTDAILVRYDFSNTAQPTAPATVATNIEAANLSFGKTIADAFSKTPPTAEISPSGGINIRSSELPNGTSTEGGHYIEFTLKAPEGKRLSVTGIAVSGRRSGDQPALYVYPRIKTSFDNYATAIALGQIKSTAVTELKKEINGLTVEGSVTFRLYLPAINRGIVRVALSNISLFGNLSDK